MVVALRVSPPIKGKPPKLNMLELVTEVDSRYTKHKLRRRHLPQAYCYVCSRIDPSGIFRNPNSYLFRKGFFQACEHFPKAPHTTFVKDEVRHKEAVHCGRSAEFGTRHTVAPSISVTIKHSSEPVSQYDSPLRRERTFGSSVEKRVSIDETDLYRRKLSDNTTKLPPITPQSRHAKSRVSAKTNDKLSDVFARLSGQHLQHSEDEVATVTPSVTVIPYGEGDEFSESQSKITELSTFTKGTTPSKSTNDIDSKPFSHTNVTSSHTARTELSSTLDEVLRTKPYINESDGLDVTYGADPLLRDSASLESLRGTRARRPRAGRGRERGTAPPGRPESGHLRYHHRVDDDSVPDPGFVIPPTPSGEESLSIATSDIERLETQRLLAYGNVFAGSSTGYPDGSVTDDASLRFSDQVSRSRIQSQIPSQSGISGKRSVCRCNSEQREQSGSENACQTCGKSLLHESSTCSGRSSTTKSGQYGPPPTSQGSTSSKSRQKMLNESRKLKSKTVTDEDYMDLDSIIHEDDGHYFSSDDDDLPHHFDNSPETFDSHRKLRGEPIVDPDLHKIVYLRALRESQLRRLQNIDVESEDLQNVRRSHVFSYFQLWPHAEMRLEPIGLRPPEPVKVKNGQFMKHIFRDVNVDDFYPAVKKSDGRPSVSKRAGGKVRRVLPEVPKDKGVSSVSLKMSKSDIRFDEK